MKDKKYKIGFIGIGNLASHLAPALYDKGHQIAQLIGTDSDIVLELADIMKARHSSDISAIDQSLDIIFLTVPDKSIHATYEKLHGYEGIVIHTSGSVPLSVFGENKKCGVLYPLQSFTRSRDLDFREIPVFIEADDKSTLLIIRNISELLTDKVYEIDSARRAYIHLAAVFANNFTNHMIALSQDIIDKAGMERDILTGLIKETIDKAIVMDPKDAQTGPAVRGDESTIKKHLNLLSFSDELYQLYKCLTKSVQNYHFVRESDN